MEGLRGARGGIWHKISIPVCPGCRRSYRRSRSRMRTTQVGVESTPVAGFREWRSVEAAIDCQRCGLRARPHQARRRLSPERCLDQLVEKGSMAFLGLFIVVIPLILVFAFLLVLGILLLPFTLAGWVAARFFGMPHRDVQRRVKAPPPLARTVIRPPPKRSGNPFKPPA